MSKWYEKAGSYINPLNAKKSWDDTINNRFTRDTLRKAGLQNLAQYSNPLNAENYIPFAGGISQARDIYGKLSGNDEAAAAAEEAARAQETAVDRATASTERMFQSALDTQRPWLDAGSRGLNQLEAGIGSGAFETQQTPFQELQFDFEADPGYQFRMNEGTRAIEASRAAKGGLFSGRTGIELQNYGQELASQEYGAAYNRFADQRDYRRQNYQDDFNRDRAVKTDKYNRLASLSGVGQLTSGNVAGQQIAQGGNLGNLALQRGNMAATLAQSKAQLNQQTNQGLFQLGAAGLAAFSDRRLKENIEPMGTEKGHKVYGYNYIGDPVRRKGVMAQEVTETNPDAVFEVDGFLAVDYGKLGLAEVLAWR